MFNKNFHGYDNRTIVEFPKTIEINEHKAPTDDSIRLAKEFYEKAQKDIIKTIKVDNNIVKGECYIINSGFALSDITIYYKLQINGKDYNFKETVKYDEYYKIPNFYETEEQRHYFRMLYFLLNVASVELFEQMTKQPIPEDIRQSFLGYNK